MADIFLVYSWCKLLAVNLKSFTKRRICLVTMETSGNKSSRQIAMCLNEFNVQIKLIQLVLTFFLLCVFLVLSRSNVKGNALTRLLYTHAIHNHRYK